jgi:DNA-binding response OmpR family regulator
MVLRGHELIGHAGPVLVVDDDEAVRAVITRILTLAGYDVVAVGDAEAALAILDSAPFAAVLLDNGLPGMTGVELLARLWEGRTAALLPVILVTGNTDLINGLDWVEAGATDSIAKPFESSELLRCIEMVLRRRAAHIDT